MSFVSSHGDIAETLLKASSALSTLASRLKQEPEEGCETGAVCSLNNEIERLQIWSQEHNVSTGKLDHMLREATHLRNRVLSLLRNLCYLAGSEVTDLISISRVESPTDTDSEDGTKEQRVAASGPPENEALALGHQTFDAISVGDKSCSSGLDTNISLDDSLTASSTTGAITGVRDVISLLFELAQTLQDPAPHDRLKAIRYKSAAQPDLHHASTKFPNADEKLVTRLGFANWERRMALTSLRAEYERKSQGTKAPEIRRTDLAPSDFAYFVDESSELEVPLLADASMRDAPAPSTVTASETNQTTSNFNFSGYGSKSTPGTELSTGPAGGLQYVTPVDQNLKVPAPPEPNQHYEGEVFLCPYCFRHISDLKSRADWIKHVFGDLEPYMCTYGDCVRPDKTYGERRIWWEHETESHRTQRSWSCAPCLAKNQGCEFGSLESFEQHIREHHPNVSQVQSIREICEKQVGVGKPHTKCPLCLDEIQPMDLEDLPDMERSVRQHVAEHLEQLALFVALPAGQTTLEDDEPEFADDSDSGLDERVEIESIISDDRNLSRKEVRIANVRRFLVDQEDPTNVPLGDHRPSEPVAIGTPRNVASDVDSNTPDRGELPRKQEQSFPVHTVLHPPNEHFYGRNNLLAEVDKIFSKPGSLCILHGVGGVGKTLTAVEYIHRYRESFDAVFWLQADTAPGLSDSYLQLATALGFAQDTNDHLQAGDKSRLWLQETDRRWLLIFDNVEKWEAISPYLPYPVGSTNGAVLITTQSQDLPGIPDSSRQLKLEPLDEEAGSEMLLGYLSKDGKADPEKDLAREISTFVGGLPVAIAHVAGYADYSGYSLDELLETFREWRRRTGIATDEADDLPTTFRKAAFSYDETLAMVWNVTLRELSRDAQDVMYILAYLNCEAVPESMLWGYHEEPSLHFLDIREKMRSMRIKNSLVKRRLVHIKEVDGEMCFSIHRSLQRNIRDTLAQDEVKQQLVFDQAVALVREVFPQSSPLQQPTPDRWPEYQRLLPHLHTLHDAFYKMKPQIKGSTDLAKILSDAGMDQHERGITKEGLLLLRTAEDVLDSIASDPQDVMRADIHAVIAMMYDNTGIGTRTEALRRRQIALRIRQKVVDEAASVRRQDEVLLYNSHMELAIAHLHFHRYEEAEPIIEKCLQKYQEWGSGDDEPFEYAKYYNKMGLVRMYQGRFDEAIKLAEQGVRYMNKTGYTLFESRFKFDLACIVLQSGNIQEAMRLHREIFDARLDKLGQSNELTLHSRYAIGALYEIKGQPEEAEFWFRKALDRWRAASWPDEAVSRAQFHLARVLQLQGKGDLEETRTLHEKALEVLHRLLPLDPAPELRDVTDEAILFDHMLTISGARFTGQGLLQCFMKKKKEPTKKRSL